MTSSSSTLPASPAWSRSRVLGWVLVALVLVFAMVRAVAWSIADDLAYIDPPAALKVRSEHPVALGSVAEFNWALGRYGIAQGLAKRAMAASPLNGAGYRVLALVAAAQGQAARAAALMQTALKRTPGDLTARRWLADRAQAAGEWHVALPLQDRLLRQSPEEGSVWFEEWTAHLGEPAVRQAMVPVLAAAPPWSEAFLAHYAQHGAMPKDVDALFAAVLLNSTRNFSKADASVWLERLVADGRWTEAQLRWQQLSRVVVSGEPGKATAPGTDDRTNAVVNGGFETSPGLPPFDWTLRGSAGVQVALTAAPGRPGQTLRLQFLGTRSAFSGLQQVVLVAPGRHELHWAYRLDALNTPRGLRWVANCVPTGTELGASSLLAGQTPWRDGTLAFEVPAGCPAVALRLELAARIPAETQAYGTAWFDDVRLEV